MRGDGEDALLDCRMRMSWPANFQPFVNLIGRSLDLVSLRVQAHGTEGDVIPAVRVGQEVQIALRQRLLDAEEAHPPGIGGQALKARLQQLAVALVDGTDAADGPVPEVEMRIRVGVEKQAVVHGGPLP